MGEWEKRGLQLRPDHLWRARPGSKIFVADRGAVRLDFPETWVVIPTAEGSIKFHDKQPPDDDCTLQLTVIHLSPDVDWTGLPLAPMLEDVIGKDSRNIIARGEIMGFMRSGFELAWTEVRFIHPSEHREAHSRACLARKETVQILLTFDFWASDVPQLTLVWDEVLRSLRLAAYIGDPTLGDRGHG